MNDNSPVPRSEPPSAQKSPSPANRVSASSLLSQFKAHQSPSSLSRMNRTVDPRAPASLTVVDLTDGEDTQSRETTAIESLSFPPSRTVSDSSVEEVGNPRIGEGSAFSTISVRSAQEVIDLTSPRTRMSLSHSAGSDVEYSEPTAPATSKANRKMFPSERIMVSDTDIQDESPVQQKASKPPVIKPDTARNRVRDIIATETKAKRDAYLLYHKDKFLPLLPEENYITKLNNGSSEVQPVVPHHQLLQQPQNITATLKPYQLKGLSFLATMYENGMSAILGDEMGLGKTLQTLSLIQYLEEVHPSPPEIPRPYLVVCPLSVLESWFIECRKWTPNLRPMRFHGNASERDHLKQRALGRVDRFGQETTHTKWKKYHMHSTTGCTTKEEAAGFDILITTYEVFVAEASWIKKAFVWRYVILDEGHKIKNEKTQVSQALQGLKAEHRLLLTGTPLQNNLREMWALLHWLYPDVFIEATSDMFAHAFDIGKGKVSTSFIDHARRLLELVMLRRLKDSPGVNLGLPPKHEVLLYVPLTPIQRFWYTRLLTRAGGTLIDDLFTGMKGKEERAIHEEHASEERIAQIEKAIEAADLDSDHWAESREYIENAIESENAPDEADKSAYKKLLNLVMQLRKCCIHPYQITGAAPDPYTLGDHVMRASGKFVALSKLVDQLVLAEKKKILIFSGFTHTLDYCEDLLTHKKANTHDAPFRYLRLDGDSARAKRNLDIHLFSDMSSDFRVMLISTKAGGLGLNLTAATEIVFLDDDWNPQVTLQAEARAHRIGQTKPVTIYKICTQGTVEEQMMGRIRKKMYLSAKITESMRDIHSAPEPTLKRKRPANSPNQTDDDMPQLGMSQLMSLIRRGASTLAHPEIDINEMMSWDFKTLIEKCKDCPVEIGVTVADKALSSEEDNHREKEWLAKMERVECAVLDGVKYQRQIDAGEAAPVELSRADRRIGKNTTVMVDGFAVNKESLLCADWEAVPTMAGKDPRLATPKRAKAPPIQHQDFCQTCHDGGEVILCTGCPRVYHEACLSEHFRTKAGHRMGFFHCSQHQCFDCEKSTSDAGGLIYRCRWCENGFCEDCLDWDKAKLIGGTLPEYDILEYASRHAWYVECHNCVESAENDSATRDFFRAETSRIEAEYQQFVQTQAELEEEALQAAQQEAQRLKEDAEKQNLEAETTAAGMADATTVSPSGGPATPQGFARPTTRSSKKRRLAALSVVTDTQTSETQADTLSPSDVAHPATNGGYLRRGTPRTRSSLREDVPPIHSPSGLGSMSLRRSSRGSNKAATTAGAGYTDDADARVEADESVATPRSTPRQTRHATRLSRLAGSG